MGTLHLGTDGGGSIRIPAGFCGVFGIKPTFGVVPAYPPTVMGTLSHQGPIARTVGDAAAMLAVISAPDPRDWSALNSAPIDDLADLDGGVDELRVAYSADLGYVEVDPEVRGLVDNAVKVLADRGARIEEVSPGFDNPADLMNLLWSVGLAVLSME